MTDKERILTVIIKSLQSNSYPLSSCRYPDKPEYGAYFDIEEDPQVGDLVLCSSSNAWRTHEWSIGWYTKRVAVDEAIIREIGSQNLCRCYNESFAPIRGIKKELLLEGYQFKFREKVLKVFAKIDCYQHRYAGISFPEEWVAEIGYRQVFTSIDQVKPVRFRMPFKKRTPMREIRQNLEEAGFGTHVFSKND